MNDAVRNSTATSAQSPAPARVRGVTESETGEAQEAARVLGIKLHVLRARTESDIETAFASLT